MAAACEEIIWRGLQFGWSAFARVDTAVDEETLGIMKKPGAMRSQFRH
ncbi:MAG: hypothetical protein R2860_13565 [Desulfobacterales bacterium]